MRGAALVIEPSTYLCFIVFLFFLVKRGKFGLGHRKGSENAGVIFAGGMRGGQGGSAAPSDDVNFWRSRNWGYVFSEVFDLKPTSRIHAQQLPHTKGAKGTKS